MSKERFSCILKKGGSWPPYFLPVVAFKAKLLLNRASQGMAWIAAAVALFRVDVVLRRSHIFQPVQIVVVQRRLQQ